MNGLEPTIIVLFGATGDLAQRKLIPALFDLFVKDLLPKKYAVLGLSRGGMLDREFRAFASGVVKKNKHKHSEAKLKSFLKHLYYMRGDFSDKSFYKDVKARVEEMEGGFGQCSNKLYYLAVPPSLYEMMFTFVAKSGLSKPCSKKTGWARVLVEKPFGNDLKSAQKLDRLLSKLYKEEQVYRIDHYLGKEMVENILAFRFSNIMFEPLWSKKYISRIEIRLHEKIDVKNRGSFYDGVGALRDVGQNHALQMLALVAMERPRKMNANAIRKARASVLKSLKKSSKKTQVRAQYVGFGSAKGVKKGSQTETFFRIETELSTAKMRGVPVVIEAGKALKEKRTDVTLYFHECEVCDMKDDQHYPQHLTFSIHPDEHIDISFWAKQPGFDFVLEERALSFSHDLDRSGDVLDSYEPDAYERVLHDCIVGDQTIFTSSEEVEAAWRFITPIVNGWSKNNVPLQVYKKGSKASDI